MNDTPSNDMDNAATSNGDEPARAVAGQRLAEARRANNISIAEIAKELHLDENKVQALEENQFEVLGAPVFAKGHMRKYAELVGVPIDDMLADYYELNRSTGAPPVVGPRKRKPPRELAFGPWIVGILVVAILAAVLHWWLDDGQTAGPTARAPGVLEPFASERQSTDEDSASILPPGGAASQATVDAPPEPGKAMTSTIDVVAVDLDTLAAPDDQFAGGVRLVLTYTGDCWTEVTDANGDLLFIGKGTAGQTITRNGIPPLHALFGKSSNVKVTVDGVAFPISAADLRGNTARVTINAR